MLQLPASIEQGSSKVGAFAYSLAGLSVLIASVLSFYSMFLHLKNYRRPDLQRLIIRILWMVPVYAVASFVSLSSKYASYYIDTIRDVYEAFVIYSFFTFLINYLGGERALLSLLQERLRIHHLWPFHHFFSPMDISDPDTFLFLRRGVLQFVVIKPALAILIMVLKVFGQYEEGFISWESSYLYLSFAYNISVCWSMYCLVLFYIQCSHDLQPCRPMPKFICVKAIIFLTFWQGLFVAFLVAAGVISGSDQDELYSANNIALALQDVMICFEMPFFVWLHWYAFPWTDFDDSRLSSRVTLWYAVRDALGIKDLVQDTYYVFVNPPDLTRPFLRPSYRSYAETHSVAHWIEDEDEFTDTYYGSSSRNESSPLASSNNNERLHIGPSRQGRLYLGSDDENTAMLLEFSDPSEEEEQDYVQARQFVFGDFNFPVVHEDPRYHHPPQVRRIIEQHATHFNEQVAHRGANPGVSRELNSQAGYGSNGDQISPTSAAAHASDSRARSDFILVDDKENRSIGTSE
ncbi:hypothetical protein BASA50_000810 [Batrachochytrium salamandrivorans]|uniref:DUF300-domain-containing protein n=1 Tax=Batrachochytrium salamandrivorans TaxID=1357716 RepID=A0ABQ8ET38_9FUNG|nr:hypothetical protein BASA62_000131 [Batrachochytrium salamandrivorans]KAH6586105.1 hypothetical protein BASA50_000810 [Batrachochytrium salamandrivorans]KAH9271528.1 hypothetical protein BASA83_006383 [Batrachochytrium salamandrivorans]